MVKNGPELTVGTRASDFLLGLDLGFLKMWSIGQPVQQCLFSIGHVFLQLCVHFQAHAFCSAIITEHIFVQIPVYFLG